VHAHGADREHGLCAESHRGDRTKRGFARDPDDGYRDVLVQPERAARRRPVAVQDDRSRASARGVDHGSLRRLAGGDQRSATCDPAEALGVEERLEVCGRTPRRRKPLERRFDLEAELFARAHGAAERDPSLERELETRAERDAYVA
jgi:hypothetical protein